jgi:hypothetical protein
VRGARRPSYDGGVRSAPFVIFAALWSLAVVAFDALSVHAMSAQLRTAGWSRVDGEIVSSAVRTKRWDPDNLPTHGLALDYVYVAAGQTHHGHHYDLADTSTSGTWAEDTARTLPAGARVPVFYDPENPSEAVLRAGLPDGGPVLLGLFLLPFNAVIFAFVSVVRRERRLARRDDETGGLRLVEAGPVTRVLPEAYGPAASALLGAGLAAFVVSIGTVVGFGFEPPSAIVRAALAVVLGAAALGLGRAVARGRSGSHDLVLDAEARTLRLPRGRRGEPREPLPWASIAQVVTETMKTETTNDGGSPTRSVYRWVSLVLSDGARVRVRSATWSERDAVERFRRWLEARLAGAPTRDPVLRDSTGGPHS